MTARRELVERFKQLERQGLKDVRFTLDKGCSPETAFQEVNALYKAVDDGHSRDLDFADSQRR